jgi:hypothetical protein
MGAAVLAVAVGVLVAAPIIIGVRVALPRGCYGGRAPRGMRLVAAGVVILAASAVGLVGWVA